MIVSTLQKIVGSARDVAWGHGRSRRFLLKKDAMGFTLTDTLIEKGVNIVLQYRNHLEACYILEGEGLLTNEETGEKYAIAPGLLYALDKHERHRVEAYSNLRAICVFSPALEGNEKHSHKDKDSKGDSSY